jgi:hypothetical protein
MKGVFLEIQGVLEKLKRSGKKKKNSLVYSRLTFECFSIHSLCTI